MPERHTTAAIWAAFRGDQPLPPGVDSVQAVHSALLRADPRYEGLGTVAGQDPATRQQRSDQLTRRLGEAVSGSHLAAAFHANPSMGGLMRACYRQAARRWGERGLLDTSAQGTGRSLIVDIGAGTGGLLWALAQEVGTADPVRQTPVFDYWAIDPDDARLDLLKQAVELDARIDLGALVGQVQTFGTLYDPGLLRGLVDAYRVHTGDRWRCLILHVGNLVQELDREARRDFMDMLVASISPVVPSAISVVLTTGKGLEPCQYLDALAAREEATHGSLLLHPCPSSDPPARGCWRTDSVRESGGQRSAGVGVTGSELPGPFCPSHNNRSWPVGELLALRHPQSVRWPLNTPRRWERQGLACTVGSAALSADDPSPRLDDMQRGPTPRQEAR